MAKKKKRKIPWPVNEYFVNEETKTIYLRGSWSRAMMLNFENRRTQIGFGVRYQTVLPKILTRS